MAVILLRVISKVLLVVKVFLSVCNDVLEGYYCR